MPPGNLESKELCGWISEASYFVSHLLGLRLFLGLLFFDHLGQLLKFLVRDVIGDALVQERLRQRTLGG